MDAPLTGYAAFFDATTGIAAGTNASMSASGGGWWRCGWMLSTSGPLSAFRLRLGNVAPALDYTVGQSVRLRAPQIEIGAKTSYVPNASSSVAATRTADTLTPVLPPGAYEVSLRYASGPQQTIGLSGGDTLNVTVPGGRIIETAFAFRQ